MNNSFEYPHDAIVNPRDYIYQKNGFIVDQNNLKHDFMMVSQDMNLSVKKVYHVK